jgi:hypothetical protein
MTRKDHILIAWALDESRHATLAGQPGFQACFECIREFIADALAWNNGQFDRDWFIRATEGK